MLCSILNFYFFGMIISASIFRFQMTQNTDGCLIANSVKKKEWNSRGEESYEMSPLVLTLGVGNSIDDFTGKHFAAYLVNRFHKFIHDRMNGHAVAERRPNAKVYNSEFLNFFDDKINSYRTKLLQYIANWLHIHEFKVIPFDTAFYTTSSLISIFFEPEKNKKQINVAQIGSSTCIVLRKTQIHLNFETPFVYLPTTLIADELSGNVGPRFLFNLPDYQLSAVNEYSFEASADDIVVVGSEGLFNNVPTNLLVVIPNLFIEYLSIFSFNPDKITASMDNFVQTYIALFSYPTNLLLSYLEKDSNEELIESQNIEQESLFLNYESLNSLPKVDKMEAISNEKVTVKQAKETRIDKILKNFEQNAANFNFEKDILIAFCKCSLKDVFMNPFSNENEDIVIMSDCVQNSILSHLGFNSEKFAEFKKVYNSKYMAQTFANVAYNFSVVKGDFPTPKFVKSLKSKKTEKAAGVPGDITVMAPLVVRTTEELDQIVEICENKLDTELEFVIHDMRSEITLFMNGKYLPKKKIISI